MRSERQCHQSQLLRSLSIGGSLQVLAVVVPAEDEPRLRAHRVERFARLLAQRLIPAAALLVDLVREPLAGACSLRRGLTNELAERMRHLRPQLKELHAVAFSVYPTNYRGQPGGLGQPRKL